MDEDGIEHCLAEYTQLRPVYRRLAEATAGLLEKLIEQAGVTVHSIDHRTKDTAPLREKLSRPTGGYECLTDVTDLAGVRVITYFSDHVDVVAGIVEAEFQVAPEHSLDRRQAAEPERFGYASVHYMCELSTERLALAEYQDYREMLVEIQIRTILQHAWAEIEHDLGYKAATGVPYHIRRKFSRLAGVLELADDEFLGVRRELDAYAREVPGKIAASPGDVTVDKISLWEFVRASRTVAELNKGLARAASAIPAQPYGEFIAAAADMLPAVGVSDIGELASALEARKQKVLELGRQRLGAGRYVEIPLGLCLLYLIAIMLGETGSLQTAEQGLERLPLGVPKTKRELAETLVEQFGKP